MQLVQQAPHAVQTSPASDNVVTAGPLPADAPSRPSDSHDAASGSGNHPSDLLTEQQLSDHLQVSVRTLQRWRKLNQVPHILLPGGIIRYHIAVVTKWLQNGCPKPRSSN